MSDVTQILSKFESGDPAAAEELLLLVYDELRQLARAKLAHELPGHTLQATALVHEAYVRLVDGESAQPWDSRGHFFAAAAEAMRRILIETARRKQAQKRGHGRPTVELGDADLVGEDQTVDLFDLSEAVEQLAAHDRVAGQLAKLRIFTGLSVDEAGQALGVPRTSAYREWTYAQAWLRAKLSHMK